MACQSVGWCAIFGYFMEFDYFYFDLFVFCIKMCLHKL